MTNYIPQTVQSSTSPILCMHIRTKLKKKIAVGSWVHVSVLWPCGVACSHTLAAWGSTMATLGCLRPCLSQEPSRRPYYIHTEPVALFADQRSVVWAYHVNPINITLCLIKLLQHQTDLFLHRTKLFVARK